MHWSFHAVTRIHIIATGFGLVLLGCSGTIEATGPDGIGAQSSVADRTPDGDQLPESTGTAGAPSAAPWDRLSGNGALEAARPVDRAADANSGQVAQDPAAGAPDSEPTASDDAVPPPASDQAPVVDPNDPAATPAPADPEPTEPTDPEPTEPEPTDTTRLPDSVWSALTGITVVNPLDYGAVGNGTTDDFDALQATIAALPAAGGIVYFPAGKSFRKNAVFTIDRDHVKLWAPNRQAEIYGFTDNQCGRQSLRFEGTTWSGVFGIKLRSDIARRCTTPNDSQLPFMGDSTDIEIVGTDISGTGTLLYGATRIYIEGNYFHQTWADHIHHTHGTRYSWVWDNWIANGNPTKGDDGIACVTYGRTSPRCGDMEWWNNVHLGSTHGRGYAIVGGDNIHVHHNWAISTQGAGLLIGADSAYDSATSSNITADHNWIYKVAKNGSHPGMLIEADYPDNPVTNVAFTDNVVVDTVTGVAYNAVGTYTNVTNTGMSTSAADFPGPVPTAADIAIRDTSVLKTRDTSFVAADKRAGLYRIHVRKNGQSFEQRFEYVVAGPAADMTAFLAARDAAGDYLSERRTVGSQDLALLLTASPVALPASLHAVSFEQMRAGDLDGSLAWLWKRVNDGSY